MTDTIELIETGDPFTDGIVFAAGATVFAGAALLAGFGLAELLKRNECQERER